MNERDHIVSMKLNMKERDIEYFVNNKSIGIPFDNLPIGDDIKYRLAISLEMEIQVTLMNFEYLQIIYL